MNQRCAYGTRVFVRYAHARGGLTVLGAKRECVHAGYQRCSAKGVPNSQTPKLLTSQPRKPKARTHHRGVGQLLVVWDLDEVQRQRNGEAQHGGG